MKKTTKKSIPLKTVSVLFATLLWLFVLNNIDNPFQNTYIGVPINIQNEGSLAERGLGIKNKGYLKNVEVQVKGRKDQIANVTTSDLEAYVDFSSIKDAGIKELKVQVISRRDGIQVADIKPATINIEVDKIVKENFKVEIISTGSAKDNYKVIKMSAAPETITLEGLESVINSVSSVKVIVDINNLGKSMVVRKECKVYNKNEEEIIELNKSAEVDVNIEVAREVPVTAVIKGNPAKDFVETGHKLNYDKVLVTGLQESVDSIVELNTEPVVIDNINKTTDFKTTIRLPEGVKLVDAPKEVTVTVSVEQLVIKNFTIKKDDLKVVNMDENQYKYEVLTDSFNVGVKGRQKDLNVLDPLSFRPVVDVTGLGEGTQKVPVKLTMTNPELKITDEYTVEIKISKKTGEEVK